MCAWKREQLFVPVGQEPSQAAVVRERWWLEEGEVAGGSGGLGPSPHFVPADPDRLFVSGLQSP